MSCLHYKQNELYIENVNLKKIAEEFGTPCYVYSHAAIRNNWQAFDQALHSFSHRICYAVKANSNIAILNILAKLGSGFDIVSVGELERVIAAGGNPQQIIFSGVGKRENEMERAAELDIFCFNVESEPELERLALIATKHNKILNIALRINPDVNPQTHSHITTGTKENKFGIAAEDVIPICQEIATMPQLKLIGLACHIGSQITELHPFLLAMDHLIRLYQKLKRMGFNIHHMNIGGGLGIIYDHEHPPSITDYATAIKEKFKHDSLEIIVEPGRSIIGNAGVLLTRVEYIKQTHHKNFAIVDAGMNDLLRPALYNAWQTILPIIQHQAETKCYDIVGPVCESADFLGINRELAIKAHDLLAIDTVGAYGFCMSSNYNSRCRAAEILIDDHHIHLIRRRETIADLIGLEKLKTDA
ncbi:MAG: diaminopimelate decarboxylase [Gammaproteobacteria bacterium RIFCSPHIGHO2_12_FULL_37_34]|nr:MAG: diaminopimelate decarboxylase [Gammaproteobacteria bacterium RIFCSPHIGHO2_12_FULL_37_34]